MEKFQKIVSWEPLEPSPESLDELVAAVRQAPQPFLLPAVAQSLLKIGATFAEFEQRLEALPLEENLALRGKVAGRQLPRHAYSLFFPVGSTAAGPHTVTAHYPPDLDTAVASFWGWVDAFAARVSGGPHHWNLPGELPGAITRLFDAMLGPALLRVVPIRERQIVEGSVSLRDFCNRDEVEIAPEVEILSVVDHHRATLQTSSPAVVLTGDVQSCNVLVAEVQQRLRTRFGSQSSRDAIEALMELHAVLDDTDLLSKVTARDVECVAQLLEMVCGEPVPLADLENDPDYVRQAARRLLSHPDLYALYGEVYAVREQELAEEIVSCAEGGSLHLFADTKVQKGFARVGQTKFFPKLYPLLKKHLASLRRQWLAWAQKAEQRLHLHMVTTVADAEEVYRGEKGRYSHQDELWIWAPSGSESHLQRFLRSFGAAPAARHLENIEAPASLTPLFEETLPSVKIEPTEAPVAVAHFAPASISSRKASITPHLE